MRPTPRTVKHPPRGSSLTTPAPRTTLSGCRPSSCMRIVLFWLGASEFRSTLPASHGRACRVPPFAFGSPLDPDSMTGPYSNDVSLMAETFTIVQLSDLHLTADEQAKRSEPKLWGRL